MSGPWRFLVDEDTDTDIAGELVGRGFDAVTVASVLGKGEPDPSVAAFARRERRVLVSTDRDFLDPALHREIRVFLVADAGASGHEIDEKCAEIARLAEDPSDLTRHVGVAYCPLIIFDRVACGRPERKFRPAQSTSSASSETASS